MKHGWSVQIELLCVMLVSAIVLIPGLGIPGLGGLPVIDRDEARFAQASRQMMESNSLDGWIVPRVGEKLRLNKPPVIYWLQAGVTTAITGGDSSKDAIWMYRLPSAIAALFSAGLVFWLGRGMFGPGVGMLAGIMVGTCPLVVFDAHQARADEVLLTVTLLAQCALWKCWQARDEPTGPSLGAICLLWAMIGVGILTKGPITPFVVGATAFTMAIVSRRFKWIWTLRPVLGLVIMSVVVAPWIILLVRSVGWGAIQTFIDQEIIRRASTGVEGHWGPPGYHIILLVMLFWPGSLLAGAGIIRGIRKGIRIEGKLPGGIKNILHRLHGMRPARDPEFFLVCWLIPAWLAFELASTKLPHYVLPLYPAISLLVARAVWSGVKALPEAQGRMANAGFVLWLVLGLGFALVPVGLAVVAGTQGWWYQTDAENVWWPLSSIPPSLIIASAVVGSLFSVIFIVVGFTRIYGSTARKALTWAIAGGIVTQVLLIAVVLPRLSHIWITPRLIAIIEHDAGEPVHSAAFPPLASQGFGEDSLVYMSHSKVRMLGDAGPFISENADGYAIVPSKIAKELADTFNGRLVGEVSGFDYADGDTYQLSVVTRRPLPRD